MYHKIKKYKNRKLYSYNYSKYIKLKDINELSKRTIDMKIVDELENDITTQVILKAKFLEELDNIVD